MLQPGELNHLFIETHHMHFRCAFNRFNAHGLGEGQPKLLRHLAQQDDLSQTELARRCNLKPATVTATLERMEKAGLVRRDADADDRRISRVKLTDAGRSLDETLKQLHLVLEEECFEGFDEREREQMAAFLKRMQENLRRALQANENGTEEGKP